MFHIPCHDTWWLEWNVKINIRIRLLSTWLVFSLRQCILGILMITYLFCFCLFFRLPLRHSMPWYMMTLQESLEPASALPQTRRLINCNKKSSSMTRRIRRKKIIMKFSHMSLVLVFLLHGLGGSMSSQDAAKLTVNFGKLIRHSLGYCNTGCRVFQRRVQNW